MISHSPIRITFPRLRRSTCPLMLAAALGISIYCAAQGNPASKPEPKPAPKPEPDILVLSNGDTLHGKFVSEIAGKVTFHCDPLGDVSLHAADVRPRQVIAKRMVESLQTSAQLTTVVEADVTNIARLRERAKADFEAREGVKLTFLPFFAQATVEALKVHPKLNAVIDTENAQVTYHDAEHLGIAVGTERGLMVPVVHNAGDLNLGGLARKVNDVAARTRSGQVGPDELSGGTFTLTNTGSRGALFDTPITKRRGDGWRWQRDGCRRPGSEGHTRGLRKVACSKQPSPGGRGGGGKMRRPSLLPEA